MVGVLVMPLFVCDHVQYIYTKTIVCDHVTNIRADIHFGPTQNIHELLDSKMLA